jgi:DNA-binding beta-propeller fold protein YncE
MGGGVIFLRSGSVVSELPPGPVQPGGAAALGPYAAVADVQGNGVWVYDGATQREVAQAPIGVKLTHAVTVNETTAGFADTDGGTVLLASVDAAGSIRQTASVEAPGNPYGLAVDRDRALLFVTLTASNLLRVVDVSDVFAPRILGDVPTVTQANSIAVDPRTGDVLVTGSDPGATSSIQIIPRAELPAG